MTSQQNHSKESTNKPIAVSKEPFLKDGSREVSQPPKPKHRKHTNVTCEKDLENDPGYSKLLQKLKEEGSNVTEKLGSGSYSVVLKATTDDGKKMAMKVICTRVKNDYVGRFLPREMKIVTQLQHPNVLRFHTVRDNRTAEPDLPFVVFMTEWAEGGDLLKKIKGLQAKGQKGLTEPDMRTTFQQLCDGLDYLDQKHIVHRDLKCENIMLDAAENVKIGDFGFARVLLPNEKSKTFCGSRAYVAPEIVMARSYDGRPVDVWSVGIIMYVSTTGHFPFDDKDHKKMLADQMAHRVRFSTRWIGSKQLQAMIIETLHPLPENRPTYKELLNKEFLKNGPGRI